MKTFRYLCIATLLGLSVSSCYDMDLEPKGIYDGATLFGNSYGVKKYFSAIYNELPIEDFNYSISNGYRYGNYWDAVKGSLSSAACETTGWTECNTGGFAYWPYGRIRDINVFLSDFPNYQATFSEVEANELIAEARFLRAYYYFGLVKRYGGVPIVDKVLDPFAPTEELAQPRNTEYDCWKFIYDDLKFAMENMPAESEKGRANRYVAAALMSRAMLYAGSIAKYSTTVPYTGYKAAELGLVGIPVDKAAEFFQYSYDAAKFIENGGYGLYQAADKERGYVDLFIENTNEDIFVKQYGPNSTTSQNLHLYHSWDSSVLPNDKIMSPDLESVMYPLWELVSLFEMPTIVDESDKPVRFNRPEDIWDNDEMEPRLRAIVFFPGMTEEASQAKFSIQAGLYKSYPGTATDGAGEQLGNEYTEEYRIQAQNKEAVYEGLRICGDHGYNISSGPANNSRTGMFIRKYVDYRAVPSERGLYRSSQAFKVFRYGEILCNRAEAAYELGLIKNDDELKREAFICINELRNRAGAHVHEMVSNPADVGSEIYGYEVDENLQYIRDERARELCFENHRWWDLRRWRIADRLFQNYWPRSLCMYYVIDEGKYIFLNEHDNRNSRWNFGKAGYYEPIPWGEIGKNPNLNPQNPLY